MKYGILGGFIRLAFAKTAFAYMEKAVLERGFTPSPDAK